ncbi:YidH family protein [Tersicoccus mangrovi]|uniref:YidH family protein n=1 Tax=Tersicoccus mangrovi TaxID=3121635 RepID=UPI003A7F4CB0
MSASSTPGASQPAQPPAEAGDEPAARGALSRRLLPGGREPDPRFTLANERTFLAWIRTSLALLAGGIAIEAFAVGVFEAPFRKAVSVILIVLGMLVSGGAFTRWVRVERAMREKRPLPLPLIAPILGFGAALGALVVLVLIVLR